MSLDTMPPRRPAATEDERARRTGVTDRTEARRLRLPSRSLVVALVLACVTLMVVDHERGPDSPVEPVRSVAGEVVGPAEAFVSAGLRPVLDLPDQLRSNQQLRSDVAALESENDTLEGALRATGYDAQRVAALEDLRAVAGDLGYALLPARVIAIGPAQSFGRTVTIDAGRDAGLGPDMTVVNGDGLVGRVTAATAQTATVRLAVDTGFTVGGRVGENMELGFVRGNGGLGGDGHLDLELVDETVVPREGQTVVTWGSEGGAPFVSGVPIGEVTKVYESLRETSYRAELRPYVDYSSLDLVGVVVPSGTDSARPVIEADRSVRMP
ncbi:rod shape-determining protein MreC [Nocardioides panacisoli]|uniref:rod shape-determining protein MreC n=1 Tax=Nocardioides panacisoli TaxID=627624 RepID=UPI001C62BBC9|nr:rod shape-determining protein MreC [Nocardioides panacisoli]QYJ04424.1 rod shape-determining protein MreC [Nocardioides panacisoli]